MMLVLLSVCPAFSIALLCVYTLALASHLGTLGEPCEGRDGGPIGMMEGLHKYCDLRCRQDGAS